MRFGISRRRERRPASLSMQEPGSGNPRTPVSPAARISFVILWGAALMAALVLAGANLPVLRTAGRPETFQGRLAQATPAADVTPVIITAESRPHPPMRP